MQEKCLRIIKGKEGCCQVHFSKNEPVFSGHFPRLPVVPGVLLLQLLIELGSRAWGVERETMVLKELNNVRFRQQVQPGDVIELEVRVFESSLIKGWGIKEGRVVLEAEFYLQEGENEPENSSYLDN